MLTLRLPVDEQGQGLAEGPAAAFVPADPMLSESSDVDAGLVRLDPIGMKAELEIACRYGGMIERVAARYGLLPSLIAGFCSRRSNFGLALSPIGVEGSRIVGRGICADASDIQGLQHGLMGLDFARHSLCADLDWRDPESNIDAAFGLIAGLRTVFRRRTTLQGTGLLRASFTAFECGQEPVERALCLGLDVDSPSIALSNGEVGCGRDVLARASFFQAEGWD